MFAVFPAGDGRMKHPTMTDYVAVPVFIAASCPRGRSIFPGDRK